MPDNATSSHPRHTWIAPLASTVVTLPLAFFALVFGGMSPMACDSYSNVDSDRFDASFGPAWTVLCCGLVLALIVLITSWVFIRRRPPVAIVLALTAPATVFVAWVTFTAVVDWP